MHFGGGVILVDLGNLKSWDITRAQVTLTIVAQCG